MRRLAPKLFADTDIYEQRFKMRRAMILPLSDFLLADPDMSLDDLRAGLHKIHKASPLRFSRIEKVQVPTDSDWINWERGEPPVMAYLVKATIPYSGSGWLWNVFDCSNSNPFYGRVGISNLSLSVLVDERDLVGVDAYLASALSSMQHIAAWQAEGIEWHNAHIGEEVEAFLDSITPELEQHRAKARALRREPCSDCPFAQQEAA